MIKITILSILATVSFVVTALLTAFADEKGGLTSTLLASCVLPETAQKISVIQTQGIVQILVLSGSKKNIQQNHSFIEAKDARSDICPSEGFESLSCVDNTFMIRQQICSRQAFIQEILTFHADDTDIFYLTSYRREKTNRVSDAKEPVIKTYTKQQIGKIKFQNISRDYLTDLINRPYKTPQTSKNQQ